MIIGVTGNNEVGMQISEYLNNKYSFKYLNVDQILKSILEQDDYYENCKVVIMKQKFLIL